MATLSLPVVIAFSSLFIGIGFVTKITQLESRANLPFSSLFIGIGFVTLLSKWVVFMGGTTFSYLFIGIGFVTVLPSISGL